MKPTDLAYERRYEGTGFDPEGYFGPAPCSRAGHVKGCPGQAGGEHELEPGWIAFEDADGDLIEVETA